MCDICINLAIFFLGNLTIVFCCISIKIIYNNAYLHNSFGYICGAKSFAELIIGICFGLWAAPMAFFNPDLSQSSIGFIIGHALIFCDFLTILLHFCKSVNRFYAIFFPFHYRSNFTIKVGIILIFGVTVLSFGMSSFLFVYSCNYYFNAVIFLWSSRSRDCKAIVYCYYFSVFIAVIGSAICDSITFLYMLIFRNRIKTKQPNFNRSVEKRFFIQTCLTTILYIFMILCFNLFTKLAKSLTAIVMFTTIPWILSHLLHQLVFIAYSIKLKNPSIKVSTILNVTSVRSGISKIVI